jgi:hypothetical protein
MLVSPAQGLYTRHFHTRKEAQPVSVCVGRERGILQLTVDLLPPLKSGLENHKPSLPLYLPVPWDQALPRRLGDRDLGEGGPLRKSLPCEVGGGPLWQTPPLLYPPPPPLILPSPSSQW